MDEVVAEKEVENAEEEEFVSELDTPMWSVIGFASPIASGLTYAEATELISVKKKESVSGLCIVTDEVAKRFGNG